MNPHSIILRFNQVAEQASGAVMRVTGFIKARDLLPLFDSADLEANPRSAKSGPVTDDIRESIDETPDIFVFKTKGILVGASNCVRLQRSRYQITFENTKIEGILDGGHNTLAIGTHILIKSTGDESLRRKIRRWPDFKEAWDEYRDQITALQKAKLADDEEDVLGFLVPVEILVPSDPEDEAVLEEFNNSLLSICSARNNNVQLTLETKANKKGFYEILQNCLPAEICERVEWKTNDGGSIKVRDLIALSWIPLSVVKLEDIPKIPPQNIYRNKGECAKLFDDLMSDDRVSQPTEGEYTREITNKSIVSAMKLAAELPELYDKIYTDFPYAYNSNDGKFGKINIVKMASEMRTKPTTYFTNEQVEYGYPDGLIMPLVYGLKELLEEGEDGEIRWKKDPVEFLDGHLNAIVRKYRVILDAFRFDPQKIGKNAGSYELVLDAFKTELMMEGLLA